MLLLIVLVGLVMFPRIMVCSLLILLEWRFLWNLISNKTKVDVELLQKYNPGVNFSQGTGLVYIPGKDTNASNYAPLHT